MSIDDIKQNDTQPQEASDNKDVEDRFAAFADVSTPEPTAKKHRFTRSTRGLIAAIAIAVSLALVLAMLMILLPSNTGDNVSSSPSSDTTSEAPTFTLLDRSSESADTAIVQSVSFDNQGGKYTLSYNDKTSEYEITGFEDLALSQNVDDLIKLCVKLDADDQITTDGSLADFGLDKPTASATISYYDGTKTTVNIGNLVATKDGYYLNVSGSDDIYMVVTDTANYFMAANWWYVSTTLLTAPTAREDDEEGSSVVKEVTISGKNHDTPMTIRRPLPEDGEEYGYFKYVTTKPYLRGVYDGVGDAFYGFKSLYAERAAILHPTEAQRKSLGFDDPHSVIEITMAIEIQGEVDDAETNVTPKTYYNNTKRTITVGCKDSDGYYVVMVDGIDAIFQVSSGSLELLAERQVTNTITSLLFLKKIDYMSKVSLRVDDTTYDFELTHYPEKEEANDKLKVKMGGKSYDSANFRNLYVLMMDLERYGKIDSCPTGKSDLSLRLYLNDGSEYLGVDFYREGGSLYRARTTDGEIFSITASSVNTLLTQIDNYLNNQTVVG